METGDSSDGFRHLDAAFEALLKNPIELPCRPKLALTYLDHHDFPDSKDLKEKLHSQTPPLMIKEVVAELPEYMRQDFLKFYAEWFKRAEYLRRQHAHQLGLPLISDWDTILKTYRELHGEPEDISTIMCLKNNYKEFAPLDGHKEEYGKIGEYDYRRVTEQELQEVYGII